MRNSKMILWLAIPSIASFASMTLTGTINLIMVGQLGALAIAIVGVANIIMYNAWAIFSGVGHTVNYLVAQNYGENNMKKGIERTYIALYICVAAGVIMLLFGFFAAGWVLQLVTGSSEYVEAGETYMMFRFFAMLFAIPTFAFHGFLRGIGDTRTPMILSISANALMIFFTYVLTYGKLGFPEWGLTGAGLAVLIGEAVGLAGCLYVYFIRLHSRYHTRSKVAFNKKESKLILAESTKLGVQEFALSSAMIIFTVFVARLGTHALAANEVALAVMSLGFMPAFAFGTTATILVGQRIGQGKPQEAKQIGTETAILGCILILIIGVLEFFFAKPIARIFSDDPMVYELAAYLIMISAFLQLFDALLNIYAGGLRGLGETTFLLRVSAILGWCLFVPLAYLFIFVFDWGSVGAWLSLYVFLIFFGLAVMFRFYRMDWTSVKLKSTDHE